MMTQLATQLAGANGELDIVSIKDIPRLCKPYQFGRSGATEHYAGC